MYLRGTIERMGTGTLDMANRCREMGLPLPLFVQEEDFRVVLYRTPQTTPQTTLESKILNLIENNNYITQAAIAENLGVGFNTVKEYIVKMRKKGMIKRHGGTFGGFWIVERDKKQK